MTNEQLALTIRNDMLNIDRLLRILNEPDVYLASDGATEVNNIPNKVSSLTQACSHAQDIYNKLYQIYGAIQKANDPIRGTQAETF